MPLFLLDTNFAANQRDEDRNLTDFLYRGGNDLRIRQEIMLGIGGYRALKALGLSPKVYHVNEGHSAFLALERARRLMQKWILVRGGQGCRVGAYRVYDAYTGRSGSRPVPSRAR